jgi:hypothetical protein
VKSLGLRAMSGFSGTASVGAMHPATGSEVADRIQGARSRRVISFRGMSTRSATRASANSLRIVFFLAATASSTRAC